MTEQKLQIQNIKISELKPALYNPRKWSEEATEQLKESVQRFGLIDPILVNGSVARKNVVIGGHFRLKIAKDLGFKEVPVVYVDIANEVKEKELNIRLNKNLGDWDYVLLADFDENLLANIGFDSQEMDDIFNLDIETPEEFNIQEELDKLDIKSIEAQKGDIYQLGDSTVKEDFEKLMNGQQADMCLTDPPYILAT